MSAATSDADAQKIADISNKLKILSDQFTATLSQYQTTEADYKTLVSSQAMTAAAQPIDPSANSTVNGTIGATISGKAELYATVPHAAYWGQTGLSEGTAHTPAECLADCYSKPACTGATFDADTNYCWIRGGDGRVTPGKTNQTAVIKKTILYGYQLQELRQKLDHFRSQIEALITQNTIIIETNAQLRAQKETLLEHIRRMSGAEQSELTALHVQHDTIVEATQNSSLMVNQNYARYILYLFGAIILGIFLFKILMMPSGASSTETADAVIRGGSNFIRRHITRS
jgi:hypothetical protein